MPEELLVLAARYIAIFGLVVAVLLIFVRWRFPQHESKGSSGSGSGSGAAGRREAPSFWQILWQVYRQTRARDKEREADLRAVRSKRVIVVDPDEKSSKVLVWRLQQLRCHVTKARNGSQAISAMRNGEPADVVIADALLPDIPAVEFCDEIGGTPIVLVGVVASQREELAKLGERIGRLGKPYDPDTAAMLAGRLLRKAKTGDSSNVLT